MRFFTIFKYLNFTKYKRSLRRRGVDIDKKKKCHVHNGHGDLKLLVKKNKKVVINKIFVNEFKLLEKIRISPAKLKINNNEINLIPKLSENKNKKVSLLNINFLYKLFAIPLSGSG